MDPLRLNWEKPKANTSIQDMLDLNEKFDNITETLNNKGYPKKILEIAIETGDKTQLSNNESHETITEISNEDKT